MVCITYREYRPTCIERNYGTLIPKHLKAKCFVPYNTECEKLGENMHVPAPNVLMNLALSKNADKLCKPCHPVMEDGNAPVGVRCCFPKPRCQPCPQPPPCKPVYRPKPCLPPQRPCCRPNPCCNPDPCKQDCKDPCSSSSESCDEETKVCSEGQSTRRSPKLQTSQTSIRSSKKTSERSSKKTVQPSRQQRTKVCQPCFVPCPPQPNPPKPSYCIGKNKFLGVLKYDCHHPNCGPFITTPSGQKIFSQKRENMKGTQYVWSQKAIDDMIFKPTEIECYTNLVEYQTEPNEETDESETEASCNDLISIKNYEIKCAMIESRLYEDRSLKNFPCGDWNDVDTNRQSVGIQWSEHEGPIDRQISTSSLLKQMETKKKEACTSTVQTKTSSSQVVEPKPNCVRLFLDIPQNLISSDKKESTSDQILDMGSRTFSEFLDRLWQNRNKANENLESKSHMRYKRGRSVSSSDCPPLHQQATQTSPLIVGNVTCEETSQSVPKKFLIKTVKRSRKEESEEYDSEKPLERKKFIKRIRHKSRQKIVKEPSEKISVYDIYDKPICSKNVHKTVKSSDYSEDIGVKRKRSDIDKDDKKSKKITSFMQDSLMTGRSLENRVSSLYYDRTSQDLTNGLFYNSPFQHYPMFQNYQRPFLTLDDIKTEKPRRKKRWYFEGIRYAARK